MRWRHKAWRLSRPLFALYPNMAHSSTLVRTAALQAAKEGSSPSCAALRLAPLVEREHAWFSARRSPGRHRHGAPRRTVGEMEIQRPAKPPMPVRVRSVRLNNMSGRGEVVSRNLAMVESPVQFRSPALRGHSSGSRSVAGPDASTVETGVRFASTAPLLSGIVQVAERRALDPDVGGLETSSRNHVFVVQQATHLA